MKSFAFAFFFILQFNVAISQVPKISSFFPTSGAAGASVAINGINFSNILTDNTVYFGSIKAQVTAASSSSLTVTVPAAAISGTVSVLVNNMVCISKEDFRVTFTGNLSYTSFADRMDSIYNSQTRCVLVADLDNDGKPEALAGDELEQSAIEIYKNISNNDELLFSQKVNISTAYAPYHLQAADMNGDGKMDIIATHSQTNTVSVLKNTSTPGQYSFQELLLNAGVVPLRIEIGDLDNDGKLDIAASNASSPFVSIFRNTSSAGNLSFTTGINFNVGGDNFSTRVYDLDGDGRSELIVSVGNNITVYPNTGSPGTISFGTGINFAIGHGVNDISVTDIDGDGKKDLVCDLSVLRNTTAASISFAPVVNILSNGIAGASCIADFNGDGKADIAFTDLQGISLLKNLSTAGNISFSQKYFYQANSFPVFISAGDFNSDSKPDILIANSVNMGISFLKNIGDGPSISSFSPDTAGTLASINIRGKNFSGTTAVSFGGTSAQSFQVNDSSRITAITGLGSTGQVKVITNAGNASLNRFVYINKPVINFFAPLSAKTGDTIVITGANFITALSVSFGGTAATSFQVQSSNTIVAVVGSGSSGDVTVTNMGGTGIKQGFTFISFPPPSINAFFPAAAKTGDTITITGSFTGTVTGVNFGGSPAASFSMADSVTIQAIVGNGNSGNVSVTTQGGTVLSAQSFLFYNKPVVNAFFPSSGTCGDTIYVAGKYFLAVSTVKLDTFPVKTFTITSDTSMLVVIGNGGSGLLIIKNNGGTSSSDFNFLRPARPLISVFVPATAAADSVVTITGAGFYGVTNVYFGSSPAASFNVLSPTTIQATLGAGNSGDVVITTLYYTVSNAGFVFKQPTGVLSFFPPKGNAGSIVTIMNGNFSNTAANNIVYFGAVRATVITASATAITVTVPYGTTYQPISVTANGITSFSKLSFLVTYTGAEDFAQNSFQPRSCFNYYQNNGIFFKTADFDMDGKPDITAMNFSNSISVFRNSTTGSNITFDTKIDIPVISPRNSFIQTGDIDGDGKTDILLTTLNINTLNILRNLSSIGNILFDTAIVIQGAPGSISVRDVDGDGKADILSTDRSNAVILFRNTSTPGNISLAPGISFSTNLYPNQSALADINNDGKPEIIVVNEGGNNVSVFQNNCIPGNIQFAPKVNFSTGNASRALLVADLNLDGKLDIIVSNNDSSKISMLINNSSSNTISFLPRVQFDAGPTPYSMSLGNIDGDEYPDLAIGNCIGGSYGTISILKGMVINNKASFAARYEIGTETYPYSIVLEDFNADGKPEVLAASGISLCINRNITKQTIPGFYCRDGNFIFNAGVNGSTYQWQLDTASGVFNNITDNGQFSGAGTPTLTVNNIPSNWNDYRVRCMIDSDSSAVTLLSNTNRWLGTIDNNWENPGNWSCGKVPDANTHVEIASGNIRIHSNVTIYKLTIHPEVNLVVDSTYNLTILH